LYQSENGIFVKARRRKALLLSQRCKGGRDREFLQGKRNFTTHGWGVSVKRSEIRLRRVKLSEDSEICACGASEIAAKAAVVLKKQVFTTHGWG